MGCAIRIFNHLPPVKLSTYVETNWAGWCVKAHPIEALLCLHGTAAPITDLEWATAVMCGVGASELQLWAVNDHVVSRRICS